MANPVTSTAEAGAIFQGHVLANLEYWQTYVATHGDNVAALDRGRSRIVKAILFGLELDRAWPSLRRMIETLAPYMERRGYWAEWRGVLTQAIRVAHRLADQPGLALLYALRARLAQRRSDFQQTIADYRRTIHLARRSGDRYNEARACSNLGYLYTELGHWQRAEVLCCHALTIFEQLDSDHGRAHTENHLGILYTRQKQWEQAHRCLERACSIWHRIGDIHGVMHGHNNLGRLFNEMGDLEKAITCLKEAVHHAKQAGEEAIIGTIYMNLGIAHRSLGDSTDAANYYHQAKIIFEQFSNTLDWAKLHDNLGLLYMDQRKWAEAEIYFKQALKTWQALNNQFYEIQTMVFLAEFEMARAQYKQAADWLKNAQHLLATSSEAKQHDQLQTRIKKIRHSLLSVALKQTVASHIDLQHSAN